MIVVVPCHDERDRLDRGAVDDLVRLAERVVFVDDGSTDGTGDLLDELVARPAIAGRAEVLRLPQNLGKAEAVRHGMCRALEHAPTAVAYLDADMATPPAELARLGDALTDDVDVVLGSRIRMLGHDIARRAPRHYLGRVYATFASAALQLDVYDTQCGAKVFRTTPALRAALAAPFDDRWAFDVELLGRLLQPIDAAVPATPATAMVEVPLRSWRDVDGSGLSARAAVRATLSLARTANGLRARRSAVSGGRSPSR